MGLLVDGQWVDRWYDTKATGGRFQRQQSAFRNRIEEDGDFAPEPDRYHLYVSYACPWAHRTLVVRALKGLEAALPVSVVHPEMLENGWEFRDGHEDAVHGYRYLHQLYTRALPDYTGRVTVPVLWDRRRGTIVNNESSEIMRMLDGPMESLGRADAPLRGHELRPPELAGEIDAVNEIVYDAVNNGVYKCGFATTQQAYDEAVEPLFSTLDELERRLSGQPWLVGDRFTEADIRLFTTLYRFDPVYYVHFKCNIRQLRDYPSLWEHTRSIFQLPGVAGTCRLDHVKRHYYYSHPMLNPNRIVPAGPEIDYSVPASRGPLSPGAG